ncbi:MAG: carbohydrate-binding domain-containing protein, partial [Lachnospiraceae bacterium]|nr:carbohydrate-binding domain-containing protein [Lachnospiraceae bacterium]
AIDLGEGAKENPEAVVTLILNGVDITCEVAPAVIFYNVYECNMADAENATYQVDTTDAGANVVIADNSVNQVNGSYVARIYESYTLNEDGTAVADSKKLHKYDGAFYSKRSMNVNGETEGNGILNIQAVNEGLDSEMHLTINGGKINIISGNDGINTNEDGVSVTTVNGGELTILVDGSTGEGDGIDSNGWLVINGGVVNASACSRSGDAGIDSDMGIYLNGGKVIAAGNMLDRIAGGEQSYTVFTFAQNQNGGTTYVMKGTDGKVVAEWAPANDFQYLLVAEDKLVAGTYTFWKGDAQLVASADGQGFGGMGFGGGMFPGGMELPEGMERPGGMELPEGMERPEGMELPEGMERPGNMELPEGMQRPEGMERPEDMQRPEGAGKQEGFGGRGNKGQNGRGETMWGNQNSGELREEFVLAEGANYFSKVQEKSTN